MFRFQIVRKKEEDNEEHARDVIAKCIFPNCRAKNQKKL